MKQCDWISFLGIHKPFYKNEDDLWIFYLSKKTDQFMFVMHALAGLGGVAARLV